jgi:hypothetical protein
MFATGMSAGWAHGNGALYSDAVSEWADAAPSSSINIQPAYQKSDKTSVIISVTTPKPTIIAASELS